MIQLPAEPLLFEPIFHEKVWGGTTLKHKLSKNLPDGILVGESWELSGVRPHLSIVSSGIHKGKSLSDLLEQCGTQLTGRHEIEFPLLFKYIDAADKLSVQVHPDDIQAQANGWGVSGKTECWYVADAKPGAQLITGFNQNVNRQILLDAIEKETIEQYLNFVSINTGDVFFIPAGTVHAILGECVIFEVQQSSDTTLRFYDWKRVDSSGQPRQLHISEALDVVSMQQDLSCRIEPVTIDKEMFTHSFRVACRYFAIEEYNFRQSAWVKLGQTSSMKVVSVLSGSVQVLCGNKEFVLPPGTTSLIPFIVNNVALYGEKLSRVLVTTVPNLNQDIVKPLIAQGFSVETICALGGSGKGNDFSVLF